MILLDTQPRLTDLHSLIAKVPSYPISIKQLLSIAIRNHYPKEVIDFYSTFPKDEIFGDEDDLVARTEQLEIMEAEDQPQENAIRGAED